MVEYSVPENLYVPRIGDVLKRHKRKDAVHWQVRSSIVMQSTTSSWYKGPWFINMYLESPSGRFLFQTLSPLNRPDENWVWVKQTGVLPVKRQGDGTW